MYSQTKISEELLSYKYFSNRLSNQPIVIIKPWPVICLADPPVVALIIDLLYDGQ